MRLPRSTLLAVAALTVSAIVAGCSSSSPSGATSQTTSPTSSDTVTTAPSTPRASAPAPTITPEPARATDDGVDYGDRDCHQQDGRSKVLTCEFGDPQGSITIAAVGDSKTEQYLTALDRIGKQRGWRFVSMTKSACAFTTAQLTSTTAPNPNWKACEDWNRNVIKKVRSIEPDAVLTALYKLKVPKFGRDIDSAEQKTLMAEGIHDALEQTGVPAVALRATPRAPSGDDVAVCVTEHQDDPSQCDITGDTISDPELVWGPADMDTILEGLDATSMSINNLICSSDSRCEAVADGVLRYRDSHHLTETFILSVADSFGSRLERALTRVGVQP